MKHVFSLVIWTEPRTLDNFAWGQDHPQLSLIQHFPLFVSAGRRPKSCPTAAPCTGTSAPPSSPVAPRGSFLPTRGSNRRGCCLFRQREAPAQGRRHRVLRAGGGLAQRLLGHSVWWLLEPGRGRGGVSAAGLWPCPGSCEGRSIWPRKWEHLAGRGAVRGPGVLLVGLCCGALGAERLQARGGCWSEVLGSVEGLGFHAGWAGAVLEQWAGLGNFCIQKASRYCSYDLGRGSWEDSALMLWWLRGDFRAQEGEMGSHAFWPIPVLQTPVFLFRWKNNITPHYSRYCATIPG